MDWVIKNSDHAAVMAYRNFLNGDNGIHALIQDEIKAAHKYDKSIIIAVETQDLSYGPDYLTFYNTGLDSLNKAIQSLSGTYEGDAAVQSTAIHHFQSWQVLLNQ